MNGNEKLRPFERSRPIRSIVALAIVVIGLILVLAGSQLEDVRFLGGSVGSGLSNLGFTFLIIGPFQWVFDNKFREVFFRDIREEVRAAESVRDSGIVEVCIDSRNINYNEQFSRSSVIEVGVAFSDRLIKDYLQQLKGRTGLALIVYFADITDAGLVAALAYMIRKDPDHVIRSAQVLQGFIDEIESSGTKVRRVPVRSISHYSFVRFDREHTFLTLSTFSSRRAVVPAFHILPDTHVWRLVEADIKTAQEAVVCQLSSEKSSKPWYRNMGKMLSTKKSKSAEQDQG